MRSNREQWGSYVGFIFAAIGSAVGIGNIWRFPYIVGTSGGGAFLVPYLIIIFTFGLSFMILEFAVGRHYQTSVITSLINIRKKFKWLGVAIVSVVSAILSYYLVILGWILSYFLLMLFGLPLAFDTFADSLYPLISFFAILGINYAIIRSGVTRGIERLNKIGVLLLIGIMIPLTVLGVLLPGSDKGIDFYLMPDFSKLSDPAVWSTAFGQAFFSLSIGTGILLTYGSYLREKRSLLTSSIVIIIADLIIAFMAGLMVFSIVFAFGMDPAEGTSLVFRAMPSIFSHMEFGMIVGALFFFLLLIAGLTSSISMFQVPVASLEDSLGFSRHKSALIIVMLLLVVGLPSALSYSTLNLQAFAMPFFDLMDFMFGTFGIAISAAIFVIVVGWFMQKEKILEQVNLNSPVKIPTWMLTVVKIAAPALIISTIITQIVGIF
ncbi:MAG: sodium-dependent transporter [Nitrososphaerales archaeon]